MSDTTGSASGDGSAAHPFKTIQQGVDAAIAGDTIEVAAGNYHELVEVNKSLTLLGAQQGIPGQAPSRTGQQGTESVVDGMQVGGLRSTAFDISASGVVVDGFTVSDTSDANEFGAGIRMAPGISGTQITDNIVERNIVGIFLANAGVTPAVISDNLFKNNNTTGASSGTSIYTDEFVGGAVDNVVIERNAFVNEDAAGIGFSSNDPTKLSTNITIAENTFDSCGRGLYFFDTQNAMVVNNTILNSVAPLGGGSSTGIGLFDNNKNVTIVGNQILNGAKYGVFVATDLTPPLPSSNIELHFNRIVGNATAGLNVNQGAFSGVLDATDNWWGGNAGPNTTGNDTTSGTVSASPWLVMGLSAAPTSIGPGGTAVVTADLTTDSAGTAHPAAPFFPNGVPIAFATTGSSVNPTSAATVSGKAASSFTATTSGAHTVSATLDNQTVTITITVVPINFPPPQSTPATAGQPFSVAFVASGGAGDFTYAVSPTGGHLPPGLTLNPATGVVSGTPTTPGTYAFIITATDLSGASTSVGDTIVVASSTVAVGPTVVNLQRFGFHTQPTTFVLTFSTALNPATAEDVANYHLNSVRGHRLGRAIPIAAAVYNPSNDTVTLDPAQQVYLFGHYRLVVNGSTPTGVSGANGQLLDGKGNGVPGSDYVATFGSEILAGPSDPARSSPRPSHARGFAPSRFAHHRLR